MNACRLPIEVVNGEFDWCFFACRLLDAFFQTASPGQAACLADVPHLVIAN